MNVPGLPSFAKEIGKTFSERKHRNLPVAADPENPMKHAEISPDFVGRNFEPTPRPGVRSVNAYVAGRRSLPTQGRFYKLSSNENVLGASPLAVQAARKAAEELHLYPDGANSALREAIGAAYGIDPSRIVCGAGSSELLQLCGQAFLAAGDEGIHTQYGFLVLRSAILSTDAAAIVAPEPGLQVDVDEVLSRIGPQTRAVFVANPGNPSGSYIGAGELERLVATIPGSVLLVIDEAYAEYVTAGDFISALAVAGPRENVVVTRTFSKIYGLADLRLGWCYAPAAICDALNRIRNPFNVSGVAAAAAIAALADKAHTARSLQHVASWRDRLVEDLRSIGIVAHPSQTNFLLLEFPDEPGRDAASANAFLMENGLILRPVSGYGLPRHLRLTIGTDEANQHLVATLKRFAAGGAAGKADA